jgi:hypothetical protein
MDREQRHIIKFLRVEDLKLGEIAPELSTGYGPDVYTPSSIKYWFHQIKLGRTNIRTQHAGGRPPVDDNDAEMLLLLRKYLFSSVRTIGDSQEIPVSIVDSHLVKKIRFKIFYFVEFPIR